MSHDNTLGTPTYLHIHCKSTLPPTLQYDALYTLSFILLNELDAYDAQSILQHSSNPLVLHFSLLSAGKHNHTVSVSPRTKPVFNVYTGTVTVDIAVHNNSVGRQYGKTDSQQQYRLIVGVQKHACSGIILPYCSNTFTLSHSKVAAGRSNTSSDYITHAIPVYSNNTQHVMLISEISGQYIGTRIWDSSLQLIQYIQKYNVLRNTVQTDVQKKCQFFADKRIIELGSGTGTVGIYVYHMLSLYCKQHNIRTAAHIAVTDLGECMQRLQHNVQQNVPLHDSSSGVQLVALQYEFGNTDDYCALQYKQYDLIICSDLVYNHEFFTVLLETLKLLTHSTTYILMSYRPRIGAELHDQVFFDTLMSYGYTMYTLQNFNNVYILLFSQTALADMSVSDCRLPWQ